MNKVLSIRNLSKSFGNSLVLQDINMHVDHGEIVGFIGPNGAGKSTVMKCIANLYWPTSGTITVSGHSIVHETEKALSAQSSLIENPGLYPQMSGIENIRLFAKLRSLDNKKIQEMEEFTELGHHLRRRTSNYSLGMKQRVGLAISVFTPSDLLVIDEPTNGLDPHAIFKLRQILLKQSREDGRAILFSSHQLGEIEKICDRVICINQGRIVEIDAIEEQRKTYGLTTNTIEETINVLHLLNQPSTKISDNPNVITFDVNDEFPLEKVIEELVKSNQKISHITEMPVDIEKNYQQLYERLEP